MEDRLAKMDPDKKYRLINAAMKEFGENRFDKASTNTIVKGAQISKGLLYHYFKSKEELYNYLVDFAMNSVSKPIVEQVGYEEMDIIKRIKHIMAIKLTVIEQYPFIVPFSKVIYAGMDYDQVKLVIEKYHPIPIDMYYQHNVDEALFREGIDVQMAVKTIQFTLEKLGDQFMAQRNMGLDPTMESMVDEVDRYLIHFTQTYYK